MTADSTGPAQSIAVIGTGIAGLAAAWLLGRRHRITVYEAEPRAGGHSHTVEVDAPSGPLPIDTGFIVYNEPNYPNLTALLDHLGVASRPTEMSFAVSLDGGALEYGGNSLASLLAQKRNLARPRFWAMLAGIRRFYREAPADAAALERDLTSLGAYLEERRYPRAFQEDHLLPMAAAIWSAPAGALRAHPAASFIRFCRNHGLLQLAGRPVWRTVAGGSRAYVERLATGLGDRLRCGTPAMRLERRPDGVRVRGADGTAERFDQVVLATHADQALALLGDPTPDEALLLGAFRYQANRAVLHSDPRLMPRRPAVWSSWNYLARRRDGEAALSVTYWMNRLQGIGGDRPYLVTLNPLEPPRPETLIRTIDYAHPLFDRAAILAQRRLWSLQGRRRTWFCGAYFGAGFHEDGLQAGLAVAEALGGVRRPWQVPDESGRIHLGPLLPAEEAA